VLCVCYVSVMARRRGAVGRAGARVHACACMSFAVLRAVGTGPAPVDLLEALWLAGEMDGLTPVWQEGMSDYLPVSQVYLYCAPL
jgi:hypothetical protein